MGKGLLCAGLEALVKCILCPFETELQQSVTTHVLAESLAIRLQRIHHFIKVVLILTGFVPG
jgi:hypothetical protein